ncbi:NAD-dependent epimerase/dehydratase family protein [Planococcus sp. ISL-110]|uniref:NAD-dependent epimerase/dehydratase family protein n=1 Tax=Planococcus sp. ISL-110 TaxID=2819167 RepID=UPI001BEC0E6C|nr:NAD-dependent epimerase/dehydratase family protein [Planococcus sp. ISL-110]MBT2572016.1 NAD-dependent epimerase/dehydratase family protein [Planococcus sp. ISL-110]
MSKKNILITGSGSYVGTNLIEWLSQWPGQYEIEELSVRGEEWKKRDFSKFDSVLHVAGIAHVSTDPKMEEQYYKVNRDLTIEVAEHAKNKGVKQFIFMSSIIVYGDSSSDKRVIDRSTIPKPSNFYGNSKLQAEEGIKLLEGENFKVAIIRPPMIYGKNSKGNYPKLVKAAKVLPTFPDFDNERSMLHIDNLSEFLRLMIKNEESGLFFPQNREYVRTSEMVRVIARVHGKKIKLLKIFNFVLKPMIGKVTIVNKVFGNLIYDKNISTYKENYQIRNLKKSIEVTER